MWNILILLLIFERLEFLTLVTDDSLYGWAFLFNKLSMGHVNCRNFCIIIWHIYLSAGADLKKRSQKSPARIIFELWIVCIIGKNHNVVKSKINRENITTFACHKFFLLLGIHFINVLVFTYAPQILGTFDKLFGKGVFSVRVTEWVWLQTLLVLLYCSISMIEWWQFLTCHIRLTFTHK